MFEGNLVHNDTKSLLEYWQIIRRHKWAIISITILSTTIGVLIASSIKPSYLASARLLVEPDNRQLLSSNPSNNLNNVLNMRSFYRTQVELIRSRSLATEIIKELKLGSTIDYLPEKPGALKQLISTDEKGAPLQSSRQALKGTAELIPIFNKRLNVSLGANSEIIKISYESGDPVLAANIVNSVSKEYISRLEDSQKKNSQQNIEWLAENLEEARQKLVESEAQLQAYQSEERIGDSDDEARIKSSKLGGITSELLSARTLRAEAEIKFKQISESPSTQEAYESLQYIITDPAVQKVKDIEAKALLSFSELSNRYGHKHPKMIAAKSELKNARKRVTKAVFRVANTVKREYELAVAKEKEVNRLYEQFKSEELDNKGTRFSLAKLEREVDTNRELYNMLLTRLKEADMTKENGVINVKVIDAASPPKAPFKPNRIRIIGIAFVLGLFVSLMIAFFREFNDKTFKTGEDIAEKIKLPLLGIFPILNTKELSETSPERVIVKKPRSSIAEAVNNIRTNIIFGNSDEDPPQVIMVTSAVASEGKTTVSTNMGITLARLGPTLVIEADTRRPRMRSFMKKNQKGGVFEYVAGKSSLKDSVVIDPEVKNLYTMPVKMKPAKPIEFLSSKRFKEALAVLRKKFKFIIIDTPPILPVSDAIVLAPIVDGAILVIGAESTKHAMAKDALSRLEQVNAPVLGAVLSRANPKTFGSYGSSYYYGYGYGYSAY